MDKKKVIKESIGKVTLISAARDHSMKEPSEATSCPLSASYPCLYISGKEAPAISGKSVGDEFTMVIKAKIRSHSSRLLGTSGKTDDYDIELHSIGVEK